MRPNFCVFFSTVSLETKPLFTCNQKSEIMLWQCTPANWVLFFSFILAATFWGCSWYLLHSLGHKTCSKNIGINLPFKSRNISDQHILWLCLWQEYLSSPENWGGYMWTWLQGTQNRGTDFLNFNESSSTWLSPSHKIV